jgi:hypothetical protein
MYTGATQYAQVVLLYILWGPKQWLPGYTLASEDNFHGRCESKFSPPETVVRLLLSEWIKFLCEGLCR